MILHSEISQELQHAIERLSSQIRAKGRKGKRGHFDEDDLLQEVWRKLSHNSAAYSWDSEIGNRVILATANNIMRDLYRKKSPEAFLDHSDKNIESREVSPSKSLEIAESSRIINEAIKRLPEKDQDIIWRRYFKPKTSAEAMTGEERTRLHRAIQYLGNDPQICSLL
jgi:RNA polymerase sigma factor (sigma-70 family)